MIDYKQFLNFKDGFYIEAGANNGEFQSTTNYLEKELNWCGLLIEPHPSLFSTLLTTRDKKNIFEQCALVSSNTVTEIEINTDGTGLAESRVRFVPDYFDQEMKEAVYRNSNLVNVPANTLDNVLQKHNISKVDFLSLDIENLEYDILKSYSFVVKPKYILIETWNKPFYQTLVRDLLADRGYNFVGQATGNDDFFELI